MIILTATRLLVLLRGRQLALAGGCPLGSAGARLSCIARLLGPSYI